MNQPTAIIVTEYVGRPANPYNPLDGTIQEIQHNNFERSVTEHPCPSIANTEPGRTVMAELRWQAWDGMGDLRQCEWFDCRYPHEDYEARGIETRQIWVVPIVEQKEGEGKFGEWVSVDKSLPKQFSHVMIWTNISIDAGYAYYAIDDWLYFTNQENFWLKNQPHIIVTHWMPLPEKPITDK